MEEIIREENEPSSPSSMEGSIKEKESKILGGQPRRGRLAGQLRALLAKNMSLQLRQRKTIFGQIIFPALLILCIAGMQDVVNDILPSRNTNLVIPSKIQLYPQHFSYTIDLDFFSGNWIVDATGRNVSGELSATNQQSGLLGNIGQYSYVNPTWTNVTKCPFFVHKNSLEESQKEIQNLYEFLNQNDARHIARSYLVYESPDSVVVLNDVDTSTGHLEMEIMYSNNLVYTRREKMRLPNKIRYELGSIMHAMHSAFTLQSNGTKVVTASIQGFPYYSQPLEFDLNDIVGPTLIPFALGFLIPLFMYTIVLEKENRVREMMKMMGMRMSTYWTINYFFDYTLYICVALLFCLLEYAVRVRFFTQTNSLLLVVFFFSLGHMLVTFSFFLSSFFNKASLASVVGYLIIVGSIITGVALNQFLFSSPGSLPWYWNLWPLFVLVRGVYLMFSACQSYHCLDASALWTLSTEIPQVIVLLWVHAIAWLAIGLYLDRVLPGKNYGVPDHPFFLCKPSREAFSQKEIPTVEPYGWYEEEQEDTDVMVERERVARDQHGTVIVRGLQKIYDRTSSIFSKSSQKFALKGVNFSIRGEECFGLLGPNGAGKTTLISILTGLYAPSSGTAYVNGKNIRHHMDEIRREIGICPQFDIQWDTLTPYEHVVFYTRLKGVPIPLEEQHTMELLQQVGLEDCAHSKFSIELSGGMRRRLSVAMALAGCPSVVYLDEPTSGLDPISKRRLWDIVCRSKQDRALILTTHSMEEADVLCDRISIIAGGRLQCIGTPLHLKNKFGFGYRIQVQCKQEQHDDVVDFILGIVEGAEVIEKVRNQVLFQIPASLQDPILLSEIFATIESEKDSHGIHQWEILQTSLEDVFLTCVGRDKIE